MADPTPTREQAEALRAALVHNMGRPDATDDDLDLIESALLAARRDALLPLAASKSGYPLDHATAADPCGAVLFFHSPEDRDAFLEMAAKAGRGQ